MSSNRAAVAAAKSLKSIAKVSRFDSIGSVNPRRSLGTAAERWDSPATNADSLENSSAFGQNPGVPCPDYQNPCGDFQRGLASGNGFQEHSAAQNGSFSGYTMSPALGDSSVGSYRERYGGDEYQQSVGSGNGFMKPPVVRNGTYGGYGSSQFGGFGETYGRGNNHYTWNNGNFPGNISSNQSMSYPRQHSVNQNDSQSSSNNSQGVSDSITKDESVGSSESNGPVGTIEEFDKFCIEEKVKEAVDVLKLLENRRVPVDLPRYIQLLHLCGENKAVEEAKAVHEHIMRCISPVSVYLYNRVLEMYLKCGSVDEAFAVFDKMAERNLTTWDTMIAGLAKNGLGEEAIDTFTKFKEAGLKPDGQMFMSVFSACSVVGDAHEGMLHFESMAKNFGIVPAIEQYVGIVDMLGRIGHLDEALDFAEKMPIEPSIEVWETLMNLCRMHGDRELGDRCAEIVGELDPSHLDEQSRSGLVPVNRSEMAKEEEKKKAVKRNLLEARTVHEYRAGDTSHPETPRIYAQLRGLRELMKESGYIAETRFVLHDIDHESKEDALLSHSERLAVSYGLLSSPARSQIRVIKNLRVCGDCHNALKIMSKIVGREFVMRDAKRFHHFKDGVCSCRDYW